MNRGKNKGFTIIELMIAMAVLAFGILGFTFLNSRALQNRTFSRDLNRATVTAERVAENLMYIEYDNPLLDDDNSDSAATKHPTGSDTASAIDDMGYDTVTVNSITHEDAHGNTTTDNWFTVQRDNDKQRYHIRWEVVTGNVGNPVGDKVKLIRIFAAFEKKDPQDGSIILGGYNPALKVGPTILTFKMDPEP